MSEFIKIWCALPGKLGGEKQRWDREKKQAGLSDGCSKQLSKVSRPKYIVIPKHLKTISTEYRSFINFS